MFKRMQTHASVQWFQTSVRVQHELQLLLEWHRLSAHNDTARKTAGLAHTLQHPYTLPLFRGMAKNMPNLSCNPMYGRMTYCMSWQESLGCVSNFEGCMLCECRLKHRQSGLWTRLRGGGGSSSQRGATPTSTSWPICGSLSGQSCSLLLVKSSTSKHAAATRQLDSCGRHWSRCQFRSDK